MQQDLMNEGKFRILFQSLESQLKNRPDIVSKQILMYRKLVRHYTILHGIYANLVLIRLQMIQLQVCN